MGIGRGRTIREFCTCVILVPTMFSILWFAAFDGTGIYIEMFGGGGLAERVFAEVTSALFAILNYFPVGRMPGVVACLTIFVFLVTSANSGRFVLSMMTSGGNLNPPLVHKMVWGVLIAVLAAGTLLSGSITVAKAMAITGALPFSVILLMQIVGFLREIRHEHPDRTRPREVRARVEPRPAAEPAE